MRVLLRWRVLQISVNLRDFFLLRILTNQQTLLVQKIEVVCFLMNALFKAGWQKAEGKYLNYLPLNNLQVELSFAYRGVST
jgi:hypothetical protein